MVAGEGFWPEVVGSCLAAAIPPFSGGAQSVDNVLEIWICEYGWYMKNH